MSTLRDTRRDCKNVANITVGNRTQMLQKMHHGSQSQTLYQNPCKLRSLGMHISSHRECINVL